MERNVRVSDKTRALEFRSTPSEETARFEWMAGAGQADCRPMTGKSEVVNPETSGIDGENSDFTSYF